VEPNGAKESHKLAYNSFFLLNKKNNSNFFKNIHLIILTNTFATEIMKKMKQIIFSHLFIAVLAFGGLMTSSCKKDDQVVKIEDAPGPNFEASAVVIKPGEAVDFTNTSTGSITSHIWSFPGADVTSSKEKDPKGIKYSRPGKYTVSLTTNGPAGSNTISRLEYIFVNGLDLPLTLDAKDSIQNSLGVAKLFKTGSIANLNPNLTYTFRVIYSNLSTTPYNNYDNGVVATVKIDGKISFSIPLNGKVTNYRLYVKADGQTGESYSSTSTYIVPEPTISNASVTKTPSGISVSGEFSSSIPFDALNNFYDFGVVWRAGIQPPTITDNNSVLSPIVGSTPTRGNFSSNIPVSEIGDVRFRFYARIGDDVIYFEPGTGSSLNFPALINFQGGIPGNWTVSPFWNLGTGFTGNGLFCSNLPFNSFTDASFTSNFSSSTILKFKYLYDSDLQRTNNKFEVFIDANVFLISSSNDFGTWYDSQNIPVSAGPHVVKFRVSRYSTNSGWPGVTIDNISW